MARRSRSGSSAYRTHGSAAYAYHGTAVRTPRREEGGRPLPKARPRSRPRSMTRTKIRLRAPGEVAPFAVVGFLSVGLLAGMLIFSYAQFVMVNDQMVSLRRELASLEAEEMTLSAQYERVFDMERIQEAVGDTMVRPSHDQVVYLDLSEPDNVVLYEEERTPGIEGALQGLQEIFQSLFAYFQ